MAWKKMRIKCRNTLGYTSMDWKLFFITFISLFIELSRKSIPCLWYYTIFNRVTTIIFMFRNTQWFCIVIIYFFFTFNQPSAKCRRSVGTSYLKINLLQADVDTFISFHSISIGYSLLNGIACRLKLNNEYFYIYKRTRYFIIFLFIHKWNVP